MKTVDLTTEPPAVTLRDTDSFRGLHYEASGPADAIVAVLSPSGRWLDGFAWFQTEAIRQAAGNRTKGATTAGGPRRDDR